MWNKQYPSVPVLYIDMFDDFFDGIEFCLFAMQVGMTVLFDSGKLALVDV